MFARRFLIASALGSLVAAAVFFLTLDHLLTTEQWGWVPVLAVGFGAFMAGLMALLVRLDAAQRTARNLVLEHAAAEFGGVMASAWVLLSSLSHLQWQELALYTAVGGVLLLLVWFLTRKNIKGEAPDELFV